MSFRTIFEQVPQGEQHFYIVVNGLERFLTKSMAGFNQNSDEDYYLIFVAEFSSIFAFKFLLGTEDQRQTLFMLGWLSTRLLKLFKSLPLTVRIKKLIHLHCNIPRAK